MIQKHNLSTDTVMLDALRGVAALLVLLSHADAYRLIWFDPVLLYKSYFGEIGVFLFFILSGFLIWTSAARVLPKDGGLYVYAVHRATRIMPLYYVALAFGILAFPALSSFSPELNAYTVGRHLIFSQALEPSVSRAINPILWTLTHEAVFYCLVPVLFLARRVFPAVVALMILGTWWGWSYGGTFSPFLRLCFLFAIGMTLAHYKLSPTRSAAVISTAAAVLLGFFGFPPMIVSVAWAIALLSLAASMRELSGAWPIKAFAFVGTISYSLYIWHYMLIEMVGPLVNPYTPQLNPILTAAGFTALCLAVSWVSYQLIERPGQIRLRDALMRLSQKSTRTAASVAS